MTFTASFSRCDMAGQAIIVRAAKAADIREIQEIYAYEVLHGYATFEEVPPSTEELLSRWQGNLKLGFPYLIAEHNHRVVGFSYATAYRPRPAYRHTIEDSVYVANDMRRQGIGSKLLSALISHCETGLWREMVAVVGDSDNKGSISLHERLGFRKVGTLEAVGFKLGRYVDTVIMQRTLGTFGPASERASSVETGP